DEGVHRVLARHRGTAAGRRVKVLAVASDAARHAPVRALLKVFPSGAPDVTHVTTADEAIQAVHTHDIALVDRELDPRGADGLQLAQKLVQHAPQTPVILLSHTPDRVADAEAAETGIADFLLVPGLSADRLEHAIRYALVHRRALQRLTL